MLTGNLKCCDVSKLFLRYIHYDLNKKDIARVALHLRNCPNCMEKYIKIQKRKKELKKKMYKIEKFLRMQEEVSVYYDNEGDKDTNLIVEGMLIADEKYKTELENNERLSRILKSCKREIKNKCTEDITSKIIQEHFSKKNTKLTQRLFQFLHRALLKSQ